MLNKNIKKLLSREELNMIESYKSEVILINDIDRYKQIALNINDIYINHYEKSELKLFKKVVRLFGNIYIGFINRFEVDNNPIEYKCTDTIINKNDKKAVLIKNKTIENDKVHITNKIYLYIPCNKYGGYSY